MTMDADTRFKWTIFKLALINYLRDMGPLVWIAFASTGLFVGGCAFWLHLLGWLGIFPKWW